MQKVGQTVHLLINVKKHYFDSPEFKESHPKKYAMSWKKSILVSCGCMHAVIRELTPLHRSDGNIIG